MQLRSSSGLLVHRILTKFLTFYLSNMEQFKVTIEIITKDETGDTIHVLKGRNLNDLASILVAFRGENVYYVVTPENVD